MVVCGRNFTSEMISRIQAKVEAEPGLSRRELSRQVCKWMDWRTQRGGWQEGSCRKALAILHRRKVVILPQRDRICDSKRKRNAPEVKLAHVTGGVKGLGEVTVVPILSRHCRDWKVARALLERHHPLGAGTLRGAQMRYLVSSSRFGYLGVLTFSSGTWALQERDEEVGWSE